MSAFVTGAAGALGSACVGAFAARGLPVAVVDLDATAAAAVSRRIAAETGTTVVPVACDLTEPGAIERAWDEAEAALGPIERVVNNAGMWRHIPFPDITAEQWSRIVALNLTAPFQVAQLAARRWLPTGTPGSIVNVASIAAFSSGISGAVDYGVTKAGLVGLTIQLSAVLGPAGIRVNAIAPGSFYSTMNADRFEAGGDAALAQRIPLRRIGTPEDMAAVVAFLSLDGLYVNGVVVPVDGGLLASM